MHQAHELAFCDGFFAGIMEGKLYGHRYGFELHTTYPESLTAHSHIHPLYLATVR